MGNEKEDGLPENKLCNELDIKCSISNSLTQVELSMNNNDTDAISVCANCGKEGSSDNMNICNKCKLVRYCNATCKKKHRSKKQCERRVAELHEEELFKHPPLAEDCPICFLRIPSMYTGWGYYECCGKKICIGCVRAPLYDDQGNKVSNQKCPFCRTPYPTSDEENIQFN